MTKAPLPYFILSSLRTACTNGGKDDRKSVEVVWICAKSIGGTSGEESKRRSKNEIVIRSRKRKIALRTQKQQNRKTKNPKIKL